jgi:hypothetical protein
MQSNCSILPLRVQLKARPILFQVRLLRYVCVMCDACKQRHAVGTGLHVQAGGCALPGTGISLLQGTALS